MADFHFTVHSRVNDYEWTNTYNISCADEAAANSVSGGLLAFHRNMLPGFANVTRVTWNIWVVNQLGPIHDPQLEGAGLLLGTIGSYLPPGNVAWVKKRPLAGNPGKVALRYALAKEDIIATGQGQVYNGAGTFLEAFDDAWALLSLSLSGANAVMKIGALPGNFHPMGEMQPGLPGYLDPDKGYYNHSS